MKHPYSFAAAFIGLAPAFSGAFKHKSSTTTTIAPETSTDFAPTPTFNPNPPICGAGFTYCGYILRDSQNFNEYDILQTYCSAHKHNCPNGKPRTDPYQALYLCVPPAAPEQPHGKSPVPPPRLPDQPNPYELHHHYYLDPHSRPADAEDNQGGAGSGRFPHILNPRRFLKEGWTSTTTTTITITRGATTPTPTPWPTPLSNTTISNGDGNEGGNNPNSGNGNGIDEICAKSLPRPGNKIELLCACSGKCMNPEGDHIGRCDVPCT